MPSRHLIIPVLVTLAIAALAARARQMPARHTAVEMSGVRGATKFEAAVEGFLQPLNGRLKLRASEVDFEPGAKLGDHYHIGPGIRMVLSGELTVIDAATGKELQVRAGEYFYEAGDASFGVQNRTQQPARLLVVELLPADWPGTAMVPLARRAELEQEGSKLQRIICQSDRP
ncbi:MAG: cupin domain-containing protein [Acidobacteria bacterium]|nr:cupin domain-containing protein [Acidobacteriota bacterium]